MCRSVIALMLLSITGATLGSQIVPLPAGRLEAFRSEAELREYLEPIVAGARRRAERPVVFRKDDPMPFTDPEHDSTGGFWHAGPDDGDIAQPHGNHLVILRRGRLFAIAIDGDSLRRVSEVNAYGPDVDPVHATFDNLLVIGDRVVVIGYNYRRGMELGIFSIDDTGRLGYLATWSVRGNHRAVSSSAAWRVVGGKLVYYTAIGMSATAKLEERLPAIRRWRGDPTAPFTPVVAPTQVYRAAWKLNADAPVSVHALTTCDVQGDALDCTARAVVAPQQREVYVSQSAMYVWTSSTGDDRLGAASTVYRMPLDGSAPSAATMRGFPLSRDAIREERDTLSVLIREAASVAPRWQREPPEGRTTLLRLSLGSFGNGRQSVSAASYQPLPAADGRLVQSRFVGPYLLYGTSAWDCRSACGTSLYVLRPGTHKPAVVGLSHATDRIETMGRDAVAIDLEGSLMQLSVIALGKQPRVRDQFNHGSRGGWQTHGYFYRADDHDTGVLGIPSFRLIDERVRPQEFSASISFMRNDGRSLVPLGELTARDMTKSPDGCMTTCDESWWGRARPVFVRGRIFALLGYEIVEGRIEGNRIREVGRLSFAPARVAPASR